jgi:hypothetical protein
MVSENRNADQTAGAPTQRGCQERKSHPSHHGCWRPRDLRFSQVVESELAVTVPAPSQAPGRARVGCEAHLVITPMGGLAEPPRELKVSYNAVIAEYMRRRRATQKAT